MGFIATPQSFQDLKERPWGEGNYFKDGSYSMGFYSHMTEGSNEPHAPL